LKFGAVFFFLIILFVCGVSSCHCFLCIFSAAYKTPFFSLFSIALCCVSSCVLFCFVTLVSFPPHLSSSLFCSSSSLLRCRSWVCLRGCYYSSICFFAFNQQSRGFVFVFVSPPLRQLLKACVQK
jgi:hypothetical protein